MAQAQLQLLQDILHRRGDDAVVYAEHYKGIIKEHLAELLQNFPSLNLQTIRERASNGRYGMFLKADGTVPIHHKGAQYNIPVVVVLPEMYPAVPPTVYVRPTPNMIIKEGHPYVNHTTALVHSPCIAQWGPGSNLLAAIGEMAICFGQDPPLYTKPANYTPPPPPHPAPHTAPHPTTYNPMFHGPDPYSQPRPSTSTSATVSDPFFGAAYAAANGSASYPHHHPHHHPPPLRPPSGYPSQQPDPHAQAAAQKAAKLKAFEATFSEAAVSAISIRAQATAEAFHKQASSEVGRLDGVMQQLAVRHQELQQGMQGLQEDRRRCEVLVTEVASKSQQLQQWLDANQWKLPQQGEALDVHRVVVPTDAAARQALQSQAEEQAIDDALAVLDDLLDKGAVKPDAWLKQVRQLSRRQFFARALVLKICQMTAGPATSVPPPAVPPLPMVASTSGPLPRYPAPPGPAHYGSSGMLTNPLTSK